VKDAINGDMTAARRSRGAAVALCVVLALPGSTAAAMPVAADRAASPDDPAARERAKALVEQGAAAYDNGEYETALAAFQDAAASYASPDFHFNIGLCHERLGEYAAAARSFEAYVRSKPDAPDRAHVEQRIALLRELVAREAPEPAAVAEPVAPAGLASVAAPSRSRAAEVPTAASGPVDGGPASRSKPRSGRGAIGAGAAMLAGGAALAVGGGVAFDVLARRRGEAVEDVVEQGNPDGLTYAQTRELAREGDRFRGLQIGSISVGIVLTAVGIGLIALGRRRARADGDVARVAFAPGLPGTVRLAW
jgi:tetratricopeptide (TPR) repeat protein